MIQQADTLSQARGGNAPRARIRTRGNVRPTHRRGGFSFTEILFAVMILGIGFIMVAAVFPVAIKQTQETVEETTAADVAKGAASYLARIGTSINFPATNGKVVQFQGVPASATNNAFWQSTNGNLILSTDPRFAWIPFYSRNILAGQKDASGNQLNAPYAQVTIIAVAARNSATFTNADLTLQGTSPGQANLEGRAALASFVSNAAPAPDTVTFSVDTSNNGPSGVVSEIAEGSYIVIADDSGVAAMAANPSQTTNGFVLRVGNPINAGAGQWELLTGSDMKSLRYMPTPGSVHVFVVGRGFNNGTVGTAAGPAMDVAAYSTFIQVRNIAGH